MRSSSRSLSVAAVALTVLAVAACSHGPKPPKGFYKLPPEQRPLEVPPDLNLPDTHGAMTIPNVPAGTGKTVPAPSPAAAAPVPEGTGFAVALTSTAAYSKLGDALPTLGGATVNSASPLLSVYDVNYAGAQVLLRVTDKADGGAQIAAMDSRGQPATGDAALKLIAALKKYFGVK